jgi:uncharacterized protein (DUF4415 family)
MRQRIGEDMRIADRIRKISDIPAPPPAKPSVEDLKRKVEEIQARPAKSPRADKPKPAAKKDQSVTGKRKAGRPATGKAKALLAVKVDPDLLASIKAVDGWQAKVENALKDVFG